MSCSNWESLIALSVEGDLPPEQVAGLEAHLEGCSGCREFAAELSVSQAALKELASEDVDPAVYARVRAGVMERVERRKLPWRWVPALVLASALLAFVLWRPVGTGFKLVQRAEGPRQHLEPAPPALVAHSRPAEKRRPEGRRQAKSLPHRNLPVASEPLTIKLFTDDPNVVIYWIVDKTGD